MMPRSFSVRMYAAISPETLRIWKSTIARVRKRAVFDAVLPAEMETAKSFLPERNGFTESRFSGTRTVFTESARFSLFQAKAHGFGKPEMPPYGQDINAEVFISNLKLETLYFPVKPVRCLAQPVLFMGKKIGGIRMKSNIRNEIKAQIIRAGFTMQEVVDLLHDEYGWSDSVSNLSAKLQRESLRYKEAVELADALGYDIEWVKRRER